MHASKVALHEPIAVLQCQVFSGHAGAVTCGRFAKDGKSIITTGDDIDPSLKMWNPRTAECMATIGGYGFHEAGTQSSSCDINSSVFRDQLFRFED